MKISIGIALPQAIYNPSDDVDTIRRFVTRAEDYGYDSLWVAESIIGKQPFLEPLGLLSYVAGLTKKVRMGVSVMLLTQRNPLQLAKSLATLDQLSLGRIDVGVALGRRVTEEIFGYSSERRIQRFIEEVQVMKALWTASSASFSGTFWNFEQVEMEPKPLQKPHPPIWFGGGVAAALKRAARYADHFMVSGAVSLQDFKTQYGELQQYLAVEGRESGSFTVSKRVYIAVEKDRNSAKVKLREWMKNTYGNADIADHAAIYGDSNECLDGLGEFIQAGARHLLINPVYDDMEQLEIISSDILPGLRAQDEFRVK